MTDVAPGIITFGLGSDHSGMIVGNIFSLGPVTVEITPVPIPPSTQGGGGPYPGAAWNKVNDITNFYNPVEQQYYEPPKEFAVSVKVTIGNQEVERIYTVTPKQHNITISVLNFLNVTIDRIKVSIGNVRKTSSRILAKITNLRNRKNKY